MKIYYRLNSVDRIGQFLEETFFIKNLYPDDEIVIITLDPKLYARLNWEVFESVMCHFTHRITKDRDFLVKRIDDDNQMDLVSFGDGFLFQGGPRTVRRRFLKRYTGKKAVFYNTLTESDIIRANFIRDSLGVPDQSKIVTIHVREGGYLPNLKYHSFRDCNIENYLKAIEYLIENNYYVIRLGDSTMKRLPINSTNYVDLAHSRFTHTLAELYFIINANFHIGRGSGVDGLAQFCGIPTLFTNCQIPFCAWGTKYDIDLPQIFFSERLKRPMSVPELVISDILTFAESEQFNKHKINLIQNDETSILNSTKEMLENLNAKNVGSNIDDSYFDLLEIPYHEMGIRCPNFSFPYVQRKKISEYYLTQNPDFLGIPL